MGVNSRLGKSCSDVTVNMETRTASKSMNASITFVKNDHNAGPVYPYVSFYLGLSLALVHVALRIVTKAVEICKGRSGSVEQFFHTFFSDVSVVRATKSSC